MSQTATDRQLVTLVLVVFGALIVVPVFFAGFGMMGYGSMMGGSGGMWGGMPGGMWGGSQLPGWVFVLGAVVQLLFLAALIGGGYLLYRAVANSTDDADRALEELRVAYARGELSDEEYEQRRETLERTD